MRRFLMVGVALVALAGCNTMSPAERIKQDIAWAKGQCAELGYLNTGSEDWVHCMRLVIDYRDEQKDEAARQAYAAAAALQYGSQIGRQQQMLNQPQLGTFGNPLYVNPGFGW